MAEDNIQLPNYLCFKPSKAKIGQNGISKKKIKVLFFSKIIFLQVYLLHEF
jgi:hypothetical protein